MEFNLGLVNDPKHSPKRPRSQKITYAVKDGQETTLKRVFKHFDAGFL